MLETEAATPTASGRTWRHRAVDPDDGGKSHRMTFVLAALALLILNIGVGAIARELQISMRDAAFRIYDRDFVSVSYINRAQISFQEYTDDRLGAADGGDKETAQKLLLQIIDELDVAIERANSPDVIAERLRVREALSALSGNDLQPPQLNEKLAEVKASLARLAGRAAARALQSRDHIEQFSGRYDLLLWGSIFTSVALAAITLAFIRKSVAKRTFARINYLANHDPLTGLPNRVQFQSRLNQALAGLPDRDRPFAVLSIDLDRFKTVNDTLGHQIGDRLLIAVTRRIKTLLRDMDIVARLGGDEFMVLQACTGDGSEAEALATRLVKAIGEPFFIDAQRISIGASVGIAMAPQDGADAEELIRNSDQALYCAKCEGKGQFRNFNAEMNVKMQARLLLELDLRDALEQGEIDVYYQPLVDISTGETVSFEALARWRHSRRGFVSPADFIPLAEETGLIVPLGEVVLHKACAEAASWPGKFGIAVNLSVVQFRSGNLVDLVRTVLAESGLEPERLELEITESILIEEKEQVLKTLLAMRELGVRIALDDFGTGYSSLAYLSSFPFDKLKIDRSFVRDITRRPDSAAIVTAVLSMASALNILTTAEGVEKDEEFDWLHSRGCDHAQGFLFSPAVPSADLRTLMQGKSVRNAGQPTGYNQAA